MSATSAEPLISARNIVLSYGAVRALDGVSLEVPRGAILAIVGPNGCGKSTLLRVLAKLADGAGRSGEVAIAGEVAGDPSSLTKLRAFVPQRPEVSADFTAREVVRLGRHAVGANEAAVARALDAVGLAARADLPFHTLSGGERQRVSIARALAQLDNTDTRAGSAGVLLLDEPFSGIDPAEVVRIVQALRARATHGAVVLSLHEPGLARAIATHALVMRAGKAIASGPAATTLTAEILTAAYGHPMVESSAWLVPSLSAGGSIRS